MVPIEYYTALAAILFTIGALGVLIRRNALIIFMSIELILNSANLAFVAFSSYFGQMNGHVNVFFLVAVAAAEVAVGLAMMVVIFHKKHSVDIDQLNSMQG